MILGAILSLFEGPVTKHPVINCTQIGGRLSAIRAGFRLSGLPDNAQ